MGDSEEKTVDQTVEEEKPSGPKAIIVRTPNGGFREALVGADGKFQRKPTKAADSKMVSELGRKLLAAPEIDPKTGRINKKAKQRVLKMYERMYEIATNRDSDPKAMMAAVHAFEILTTRVYGKPSPSTEELEKLEHDGIKIVVIEQPKLEQAAPIVLEEKAKRPEKPSFIIDAEFTDLPKKD